MDYEDNRAPLDLAKKTKFRLHTKHIATKNHWFHNAVSKVQMKIIAADTKDQQARIFTKPFPKPQFEKLTQLIMGL